MRVENVLICPEGRELLWFCGTKPLYNCCPTEGGGGGGGGGGRRGGN